MKKSILTSVMLCCALWLNAQVFVTENAKVSFYSATAIENIDATSSEGMSAINTASHQVFFKIKIESFTFTDRLMQEHFNENYMESSKYPFSYFNGKINEDVNLTKPGTYNVTVTGKLTMHGVGKEYTIPVVVINENGKITANANFKVKLADHKIEIPTIVFAKIAETIDIKLNGIHEPSKATSSLN